MGFEVPMDDIDTETVGGFDKVSPGSYHQEITFVDEDGGTKGEMILKVEILRGTTANQEGKEFVYYFSKELSALNRRKILALAIAAGLTTKQDLDKHKLNGTSPVFDFNSIIGRQICSNLENNDYNGKISTRLAWDEIYHPADKRANHIPLLMVKIKAAGIVLPAGRNPDGAVKLGTQPTKEPTKSKPEPAKQAASVDELLA